MAGKKTIKTVGKGNKIILPGAAGPKREHYCPTHDTKVKPVQIFGKKGIQFECQEGCRLPKGYTVLK